MNGATPRQANRSPGSSCKLKTCNFGQVTRLRLHLATALLALLGILPGSLSQENPGSQNPYDRKAAELRRDFVNQSALVQAVAMAREYALRTYVSDAKAMCIWFESVARDSSKDQLVRDEAVRYAAQMRGHFGEGPLQEEASDPAADGLLAQARRSVEVLPDSAEALDALGQLEAAQGSPDAHDHFEQAARLAPTAERWLRVASTCGHPSCTFAALSAAQATGENTAEVLGRLAEYYASRGQSQKARTLLAKAIPLAPDDFVLRVDLSDLYFAAGMNAEGLGELRKVAEQFPGVAWVASQAALRYEQVGMVDRAVALGLTALAQDVDNKEVRATLAKIYAKRGDENKLRALLSDTVKMDPSDKEAAAMLARLEGKSQVAEASREAVTNADEAYAINASELAAKTHANPPKDGTSAVELADVRVERVAENGLSTVREQQVAYIVGEQGAREYTTRTVTYSPGAQKLQVLHARVFKADGRIVNAETAADSGPSDATAAMYYDTRTRTLRYPSLEKGDVVELDYRLMPDATTNPYGDYFGELVTFGSSLPRKLQRYVLITPAAHPMHIAAERLAKANETQVNGDTVYAWEMRDLAPQPNEPKEPATTEFAPYVHVSTFASWEQVGRWYAQLIAPQFKLDAALREELTKLTAGKNTDEERITAIHHFVLRNTHYVALEFGVFSYKPYPVAQVYARRFGDCKDKASLMIALLRAAGIDADLALVRTRRLGDVSGAATSISIFNHAVVYIPKYDLWLDGTAEYAGSHELPIDDQGAQALTVAMDGSAQLRRIPVTLPMENYTHRQVRAEVRPDGRIQFTGSAYTRGEDAPGLRREYEVTERQRANFRNRLAEVLPAVRLDSVEVNGAHDLESDVIVNFSGNLDANAGRKSVTLTPSWMMRSYVQTLAPLASRTQDLVLPAPWTTEEELHFVLPGGSRIEDLPQDTNLETPFGVASVRYQRQGDELLVKTSVQFRKLRITPAEYTAFRSFCTQVENAFHGEIKVGL